MELYNFIEKAFREKPSNNNQIYFITAAFFNYIIKDERFAGLVYPSFQNQGLGINYAFNKKVIMTDSIVIRDVFQQTLKKDKPLKRYNSIKVSYARQVNTKSWDIFW